METKELGFEIICDIYPLLKPAPYQSDVLKHQQHDQKTHGSWADGSSESGLDAMPYEWKPKVNKSNMTD